MPLKEGNSTVAAECAEEVRQHASTLHLFLRSKTAFLTV